MKKGRESFRASWSSASPRIGEGAALRTIGAARELDGVIRQWAGETRRCDRDEVLEACEPRAAWGFKVL